MMGWVSRFIPMMGWVSRFIPFYLRFIYQPSKQ
ncbi:hypothetical protein EDC28_1041 [Gallaecimonas pentaromativorans]|uniref:Uncharacterized protein n=1 Tax=Gallaecimonas pentaromativorans TaxID=584787 RepID=A0A3N1P5N6_9GAMM|nr:hypothetical protein EDC28_1041 [Gallaecimonas pentaromativorans]